MTHDEARIIKPPVEDVTSGRVFQPTLAFLYKKIVKVILFLILIWVALRLLFIGFTNPIFLEIILAISQPVELLVLIGWQTINQVLVICSIIIVLVGSLYTFIYIRKIEYSVVGWSGDAMPEIFTRKGIINITKKHVPFRTIVNVRTTKGVFDRLFGIGNVLIETAGGSVEAQPANLTGLLISKLSSSAAEEKIEGIRFDEELRDFILREMRGFSQKPKKKSSQRQRRKKHIFTTDVLEAFIEVRDALKDSIEAVE